MKDIATPVEDQTAVKERSAQPSIPLTGQEYLESLNDGREVWIYGEKVKDVTKHPAFRNSCRMIARLYDALHDPAMDQDQVDQAALLLGRPFALEYLRPTSKLTGPREQAARALLWAKMMLNMERRVEDHAQLSEVVF